MNVTVRYFAGMRDRMGKADEKISVESDVATVADVWSQVSEGQSLPDSTLIAINMEYTDSTASVSDGDEVAFFPPVTGG